MTIYNRRIKNIIHLIILFISLFALGSWQNLGHEVGFNFNQEKTKDYIYLTKNSRIKNTSLKAQHPTTVHYNVYQNASPYLDANLKISVDGTQQVFVFFTDMGSFLLTHGTSPSHPSSIYQIGVDCPIFDKWDDAGFYKLVITAKVRYTNSTYVTIDNIQKRLDDQTTPNIDIIRETYDIDIYEYSDIYISLYAY